MKLVLKIGGSLLFDDNGKIDIHNFEKFADVIREIIKEGNHVIVVVGGGVLAKELVEYGKHLGADTVAKDQLGIAATWVCAQLLIAALKGLAYSTPLMTEEQIKEKSEEAKLWVVGGLVPGQSTNAVAARIAEITNSDLLLNITDVDGIYDKDPRQFSDAKLLAKVTVSQMREIISNLSSEPGTYPLFDSRALDIIDRTGIEVWFINGKNPIRIPKVIKDKEVGSRLIPDKPSS